MTRKNTIKLAIVMLMAAAMSAFAVPAATAAESIKISESPLPSGFSEAVITTRDPARWINFLTTQAGWELRDTAPLGPEATVWNLDRKTQGTTYLLANKGATSGFIRLVHLDDVAQQYIRIDDRPWDSGGIFDLNVRVKNLAALRSKLLIEGWRGESEPIRYAFGPFEVIEWVAQGPDGVRLALIERVKPDLSGWPDLKIMSRVFNSTSIVKDMGISRKFFSDILGMKPYLESNAPSTKPEANVLGLPHNIATMIARDVTIVHPDGRNEGSVELLQFIGATGNDLKDRAKPSNLGISALRFPVSDIDQSVALLRSRGIADIPEPVRAHLSPYGDVRLTGFFTPDGAWLEIFQSLAGTHK